LQIFTILIVTLTPGKHGVKCKIGFFTGNHFDVRIKARYQTSGSEGDIASPFSFILRENLDLRLTVLILSNFDVFF
jgi:hypothetical protein